MRRLLTVAVALFVLPATSVAEEPGKVVLTSPDGKKTYNLAELTAKGPVLVPLTCRLLRLRCRGGGLQEAPGGLQRQGPAHGGRLPRKSGGRQRLHDQERPQLPVAGRPQGQRPLEDLRPKTMPTNILIDKGGKVIKVLPGCTPNGKNAQMLSAEIAKLLKTDEVKIVEAKKAPKK